jgi:COMPASS component SWD3
VNDGGNGHRQLPAHSDPVTGVSFSPDGSLLASASLDGLCRVWNVATGQCVRTVMITPTGLAAGPPPPLSSVSFAAGGTHLLLGTMDGNIRIYDAERNSVPKTYGGISNR